jgi:tetratricopeptide (TPR) repeat protein
MGGIALLMRRPEAALTIYEDVLRKVQNHQDRYDRLEAANILNRLGVALRHKGDLQVSVSHFEQALRQPGLSTHTRVVAHLELGKTRDVMGERDKAVREYQAVLGLEDFADSQGEARELLQQPYRMPRAQ